MKQTEEGLKRTIGVWGLTANIVNIIVGAGIFVLPAIVAENMGSTSLIAYLFCGLLIALIMLCFAEAGSKIPLSGGGYTYVETAFGPFSGFLVAIFAIVGGILADAAVANALVDILGSAFPIFKQSGVRVFFLFIVFFGLAYINVIGVKQGIGLVKINTVTKLIPLLLIVLIGWKDVSIVNLYWESEPTLRQIGETSLILFFAFQGGEVGINVGGEIINPKKTIPKAIFFSIGLVLAFYMLIQTVAQGVLGEQLATFKAAPIAETANVIFGPIGFTILLIGGAISMFGNLSGEVLNNPRILFATSRDKVIPIDLLARIHPKFRTPYISIIIYAGIGLLLAIFGGFQLLVPLATATVLLLYLGVVLAVIKLRSTHKTQADEFKIPGGLTVPILSAGIILYFLSNLTQQEIIGISIFITVLCVIYGLIKIFKKVKLKKS